MITIVKKASFYSSSKTESYPDYIGRIKTNQNQIDNLTLVFNRTINYNIFINIQYNQSELIVFNVTKNYDKFGFYQTFVYSTFGGNVFARSNILVQNADNYPFQGILN